MEEGEQRGFLAHQFLFFSLFYDLVEACFQGLGAFVGLGGFPARVLSFLTRLVGLSGQRSGLSLALFEAVCCCREASLCAPPPDGEPRRRSAQREAGTQRRPEPDGELLCAGQFGGEGVALNLASGLSYELFGDDLTWTGVEVVLSDELQTALAEAGLKGTWNPETGKLDVSSVPEPSAFGLLAGAFALALAVSRRRRK